MRFPDGNEYDGDFVNDQYHGIGIYTWPDGTKYTGDF